MKCSVVSLILVALAIASCKKDHVLSNNSLQDIVFQGKYLGEGCWSVIQVTAPSLKNIGLNAKETQWAQPLSSGHDTIYQNAVGAGMIPDAYRSGNTFYFTVSKLDSNIIHTMDCIVPRYYLNIKSIFFDKPMMMLNRQCLYQFKCME